MATAPVSISTPYMARYRVTGRADWYCPFCGHSNITRLHVGQAYIYCKGDGCGRRFGNGHVFYVPAPEARFNPRLTPPDYIIPAQVDPLPVAAVAVEPPLGAPFHIVAVDASDIDSDVIP